MRTKNRVEVLGKKQYMCVYSTCTTVAHTIKKNKKTCQTILKIIKKQNYDLDIYELRTTCTEVILDQGYKKKPSVNVNIFNLFQIIDRMMMQGAVVVRCTTCKSQTPHF